MMKPDTLKGRYSPPAVEEITFTAECFSNSSPIVREAVHEAYETVDLFD